MDAVQEIEKALAKYEDPNTGEVNRQQSLQNILLYLPIVIGEIKRHRKSVVDIKPK